jgi:NAD(P)-dependent dehydrogenase (short-subunit alcohol dehydrogenase family)
MARMAAAAIGRCGRIDILAANAGIYPQIPLAEQRAAELDQIMAINVRGALLADRSGSDVRARRQRSPHLVGEGHRD